MKKKLYSIRQAINLIKDIELRNLILLNEEHRCTYYLWDSVDYYLTNDTVINYALVWSEAKKGLPDGVDSLDYWFEICSGKPIEFYSSIEERDMVESGISLMDDTLVIPTKRVKGNEITI